MQQNLPSIKTLSLVFGDKAKEARRILEMTREELRNHPAGAKRINECYHHPKWYDVRLHVLDSLGETFGLESAEHRSGAYADYLNTGETYAPTIIYWQGRYRVQSLGNLIERTGGFI